MFSPPRFSLIDIVMAVTIKKSNDSNEVLRTMKIEDEKIFAEFYEFKFPGQGQKTGFVVTLEQAVEFVLQLRGDNVTIFRQDVGVPEVVAGSFSNCRCQRVFFVIELIKKLVSFGCTALEFVSITSVCNRRLTHTCFLFSI